MMVREISLLSCCAVALLLPSCGKSGTTPSDADVTGAGGASDHGRAGGATSGASGGVQGGASGSPDGTARGGSNAGAQAGTGGQVGPGADAGTGGEPARGGAGPVAGEAGDGAGAPALVGGSGGSAGAGAGAGASAAMHCTPGVTRPTYPSSAVTPCYGGDHHLPNPENTQVEDFLLDAATVPGETFAVSTKHAGSGPFDVEIWGANDECGIAEQLLWWGPMVNGLQCGEFTPPDAYTHLLYVYRQLEQRDYGFSTPELTLCENGSCPSGPTGEGLEPGKALTGAPFVYDDATAKLPNGFSLRLGPTGKLLLFIEGDMADADQPSVITQGLLHNEPGDPFGDGWYCVGAGSTVTDHPPADVFSRDIYTVSLNNLTKLPSCDGAAGNGTATIFMDDTGADITSSVSAFVGTGLGIHQAVCSTQACTLLLDASDRADGKRFAYLDIAPTDDALDPMGPPVAVTGATLFMQNNGQPLTIACSPSGTLKHDPAGTTTLSLDALRSLACPGEAVTVDSFEFTTLPPG